MDTFRFCPELFEVRTGAVAALEAAGFHWLSHFSSIDILHDVYGIEVCGITDPGDANSIRELLDRIFPDWPYRFLYYKECGRDVGYMVRIHRDPPREREVWETA